MADAADIRAVEPARTGALSDEILILLDAHAAQVGHPFEPQPIGFEMRARERLLAGVYGHVLYGWLFVKYLAVAPEIRGRGLGRALMLRLETAGRAAGATGAVVDTYGFQAEGLYTGLGYEVFGRLETPNPATTRVYLRKRLGDAP